MAENLRDHLRTKMKYGISYHKMLIQIRRLNTVPVIIIRIMPNTISVSSIYYVYPYYRTSHN